jgi:hypothetical protein
MNREAFILFGLLMGGDYDNKVTLSDFYSLLQKGWQSRGFSLN